jgi:ribonuclease BN (tRNA processing enzyme)
MKKIILPSKPSALFFSHFSHADHVADLPAFLHARKMICMEMPNEARQLNMFGSKGFESFVRKNMELFPGFAKLPFPVWIEEMQYSSKKIFGFTVKSKPVKHTEDSIGFRVEAEGKVIAYSGDTEVCDEIVDLGQNADLLVLQCSFPESKKKDGHLNAKECGETAKKANAKRLLLTHFFPEAEKEDLRAQAAKSFKGEILLAKDLMVVEV